MPWQRLLKGLREVEETPADDDIVVESHKEAHLPHKRYSLYIKQEDLKFVQE